MEEVVQDRSVCVVINAVTNERGVAIVYVAVFITAMVAMAGLMLDSSRLALSATEIQTAADLSALAGAKAKFGGRDGDPNAAAVAALQSNTADGRAMGGSNLVSLQVGNWTEASGFVGNLPPFNAVKTTTRTTVSNMLVGAEAFSPESKTTMVTKEAVAAMGAIGSAIPTLPLVLGECHWNGNPCFDNSCMPTLTQVPNTTNQSAWTSFFDNAASNTNILKYMDPGCNGTAGGDGQSVAIKLGDNINLNNGQIVPLLRAVNDMVTVCNRREFLIPIVPCPGNYNQTKTVVGFATIIVDQVKYTGNPKGIWLHGIFKNTPGTFTTGTSYGTVTLKLVG